MLEIMWRQLLKAKKHGEAWRQWRRRHRKRRRRRGGKINSSQLRHRGENGGRKHYEEKRRNDKRSKAEESGVKEMLAEITWHGEMSGSLLAAKTGGGETGEKAA
jgi:hypothetical protein